MTAPPQRPRQAAKLLAGAEGPLLLRLTAPMVLGILSTSLYGVADAYFVGRLGSVELSAIGFAFPVLLVVTNATFGLAVGTGAVVALALGEGARKRARRRTSDGVALACVLAVVLSLLGLLTLSPLFRLLGAGGEVLDHARRYMTVWYSGLPLLVLPRVVNGALRATGDTRTPALALLLGAGLNALLDPLLIFGPGIFPRLEVAGAAWATLAASAASLAVGLAALVGREGLLAWLPLELARFRCSCRAIAGVAAPVTASRLAFPTSMLVITGLVAGHGPAAVAALGLCGRLDALFMVVVTALAASLLPFVGQNWGAGRRDRVRRGVWLSVRFVVLWGTGLCALLALAAPHLAALFNDDPQVIAAAAAYLRIFSLSYGLQGGAVMITSAFNAVGRPLSATAITVVRMFGLYIPLAWLGDELGGLGGIFIGGSLAVALAGAGALLWGWRVFAAPPAAGAGGPSPLRAGAGALAVLLAALPGTGPALAAPPAARLREQQLPQAHPPAAQPAVTGSPATEPPPPAPRLLPSYAGLEAFSIMVIQGVDGFSPLKDQRVATTGVVTQRTADGEGFWIQDPEGDGEGATSDGLFISLDGGAAFPPPAVGDRVWVAGFVEEEQRGIALPRTRLARLTHLEVVEGGLPLPPPVDLVDLPDEDLADAIAFWEPLEGMRVRLVGGRVIAPTDRFGQFAVLTAADAMPGSGYSPASKVLRVRSLGGDRVDYNPERILVAAASLGEAVEVRPGDEVISLTGVVDFSFGAYKVEAASLEVRRQEPPEAPVSRRSGPPGDVRITTFNLNDLFDAVDDPGRYDERFDPGSGRLGAPDAAEVELRLGKLALAVVQELELPHIVVAQEFESEALLQDLGERVNARAGTLYRAASRETSDRRGLEVGFLYDAARVELVELYPLSGPAVEAAFGRRSPFPTREPLVGVFRLPPGWPRLTVVANKLKSKRLDAPTLNVNPTPVRVTEAQRMAQARVLRDFASSLLDADPEALVLVAGDLGDLPFAEPGEGEHTVGILEGRPGEVPLANLITREDEGEAYTWIQHGQGQALSHLLASPALARRCVAVDVLHFNAPFPERFRWVAGTPIRASDRDPIEARFALAPRQTSGE